MDEDEDSNLFEGVDPYFDQETADDEAKCEPSPRLLTREELMSMSFAELVEHASELQQGYSQALSDTKFLHWEFSEYQDNLTYFSRAVKLAHKLNSSDLDTVASIAVNEIPQYIRCDFAALFLYDNDKSRFELLRATSSFAGREEDLPTVELLTRLFEQRSGPFLAEYDVRERVFRLENDEIIKAGVPNDWLRAAGNSMLVFPLTVHQSGSHVPHTVGGLVLGKSKRGFEAKDADVSIVFADLLSSSLHNAQLVRRLNDMTVIDPLTQIYNRRYLISQLSSAMIQARRHGLSLSIAMIDIDYFKRINDLYGHVCGDDVLREVAGVLKAGIRNGSDIPARYGGEEFLLIMPFTSMEAGCEVAERIREKIDTHTFFCDGQKISVTCSIGVAEYAPGESIEKFIDRADISLYQAKRGGRNQIRGAVACR